MTQHGALDYVSPSALYYVSRKWDLIVWRRAHVHIRSDNVLITRF
jgi:hypothetical protein